jgi:glucokinase
MKKKYIVCIDLGGNTTKLALMNLNGKILCKDHFLTMSKLGSDRYLKTLEDHIDLLLVSNKIKKKELIGIGMGSPGPIDINKGIMLYSANFPGWKNVNFKLFLENKYEVPAFFENDVNMVGLGEYYLNLQGKYRHIIILTLGTGLGGTYIENGKILHGRNGFAGEFGHIQIVEKGIPCGCGSNGCLEAYISASGIKKRLQKLKANKKTNTEFILRLDDLTPKSVYKLAEEGNGYAISFFRDTGYYLGIGLKTIINIFNPDLILIGGGMFRSLKYILPSTKKYIKENAFFVMVKDLEIKKITFSEKLAFYGAFLLVKNGI